MPPITPDLSAIRRMRTIRKVQKKHDSSLHKIQEVLAYLLESETEAGSCFMLSYKQLYMYSALTKEIMILDHRYAGQTVANYLDGMYGLSQSSPIGKQIYARFQSHAFNSAQITELRRFAVWSEKTMATYLSCYDGQMWKIDGGTPHRVPNGTDEVYFIDDDGGVPVDPDIGPHGILLDRLVDHLNYTPGIGGISAEQQRMALIVWLFMLAVPDHIEGKPLLMIEGTEGAGKTAACELIKLVLTGSDRKTNLGRGQENEFGVILLRSPITILDNLDSYYDWLPDSVCTYVTGATWTKRKLYENDEEVIITPRSFIAVASRSPASFRRADTVDRQIIIRLERREGFLPIKELKAQINALRSKLFGEYIWYVNEIVAHLRTHKDAPVQQEVTRMADFARFARVVGHVMKWAPESVTEMLLAMAREHQAFASEEDPLIEVMHRWIVARPGNPGRKLNIFTLHSELEGQAKADEIPFVAYKSARMVAQNIRSRHVGRDFDVKITIENSQRIYQIWRKNDLRLLDGGLKYPINNEDDGKESDKG
jgi:hypothetical protein